MKKIFSIILSILILFSLLVIPATAQSSNFKVYNAADKEDKIDVRKLDIENGSFDSLKNSELNDLAKYDAIVLNRKNLNSMNRSAVMQLLDNGVCIMLTDAGVSENELRNYIGNTTVVEKAPQASLASGEVNQDVTMVYATNINGKMVFGKIVDCSNMVLTKDDGGKILVKDAPINKNIKHSPYQIIPQILQDNNENYANQGLVDWVYLDSNTGSFTVSIAASGEGSLPLPGLSYSTSTSRQSLSNVVSWTNNYVKWESSINPPTAYGEAFKIEPAIRAVTTDGMMKIQRLCRVAFNDGFSGYATGWLSDFV